MKFLESGDGCDNQYDFVVNPPLKPARSNLFYSESGCTDRRSLRKMRKEGSSRSRCGMVVRVGVGGGMTTLTVGSKGLWWAGGWKSWLVVSENLR